MNAAIAAAIVARRDEKGPFKSRAELKEVPRLGPKAFEQAAGFLRIRGAENPLDASAVHPESYPIVEKMAADLGVSVADLMRDGKARAKLKLESYVSEKVGLPTLTDIVGELAKPGRDPREQFEAFSFSTGVNKPEDLKQGMKLPGIVTNVTAFGAFVDVGVHQDGLVHVSQLADRFVKDPHEVVKAGDIVRVRVVEVDVARNRIGLTMRKDGGESAREQRLSRDNDAGPKGAKQVEKYGASKPVAPAQSGSLGAALLDAIEQQVVGGRRRGPRGRAR